MNSEDDDGSAAKRIKRNCLQLFGFSLWEFLVEAKKMKMARVMIR